jgi:membrane-associated phospholipid phosphatase
MMFVTNFADPAVVLPLAIIAAVMLAFTGWWRGAALWLAVVGATLGTMAVLKIALFACGPMRFGGLVQSPSGHTASAAIIYGGLAALVARRYGAGVIPAFLPAPMAAALIGFSRMTLDAHTLPEVVIGGLVGCAGALALLLLAGTPPPRLKLPRLLGPALVVVVVMHGYQLHAEAELHALVVHYRWIASFCGARGAP